MSVIHADTGQPIQCSRLDTLRRAVPRDADGVDTPPTSHTAGWVVALKRRCGPLARPATASGIPPCSFDAAVNVRPLNLGGLVLNDPIRAEMAGIEMVKPLGFGLSLDTSGVTPYSVIVEPVENLEGEFARMWCLCCHNHNVAQNV